MSKLAVTSKTKERLSGWSRLELVPQRWPLARLSISLQKSVDHLDRVLTMLLAGYLAKEVAAILREILTHPTKKLYDDNTAHLLCSNYWLQPMTRNCCTPRHGTMQRGMVKRTGPVMDWPESQHTLGRPRN